MPPETPQPNLSPEERKTLKEARAFIESIKPGQTFTMPKEYLEAFIKVGEGRPIPPEQPKPEKTRRTNEIHPSLAESILGNDFLSPDKLKSAGLPFEFPETTPTIPFNQEELERARELNQMLIYYTSKAKDSSPLTMQKINSLLQPEFTSNNQGKILYNADRYKDLPFFTTEIIPDGWYLVSKEVIPNSTSKNYLEQTQLIADYITNQVFKDQPTPQEYQSAVDEFNQFLKQNPDIQTDISSQDENIWKPIAKSLSDLKINQMTHLSPLQVIYNLVSYLKTNPSTPNNRLLEKFYTWTTRLSPDGNLVSAGHCDSGGAHLFRWEPGHRSALLGVSFLRSPF